MEGERGYLEGVGRVRGSKRVERGEEVIGSSREQIQPFGRSLPERDFFNDNLLVRIEMIWWTGLAP